MSVCFLNFLEGYLVLKITCVTKANGIKLILMLKISSPAFGCIGLRAQGGGPCFDKYFFKNIFKIILKFFFFGLKLLITYNVGIN